jgi:hypothetical protein
VRGRRRDAIPGPTACKEKKSDRTIKGGSYSEKRKKMAKNALNNCFLSASKRVG